MKFIRFEVSKTKGKKYDAVLFNEKTNRENRVAFGDKNYQQYKDNTGLGKYSHLNHNDEDRRRLYLKRHKKDKDKPFSAGYYASKYLW